MAISKKTTEVAEKLTETVKTDTKAVLDAAGKTAESVKTDAMIAKKSAEKKAAAAAKVVKDTADKAVKTAKDKTKAVKEKAKAAVAEESEVFVQIDGKEDVNVAAVIAACKDDYKSKGHRTPKTVTVYIKDSEGVAYYTVNGKGDGDMKVDL